MTYSRLNWKVYDQQEPVFATDSLQLGDIGFVWNHRFSLGSNIVKALQRAQAPFARYPYAPADCAPQHTMLFTGQFTVEEPIATGTKMRLWHAAYGDDIRNGNKSVEVWRLREDLIREDPFEAYAELLHNEPIGEGYDWTLGAFPWWTFCSRRIALCIRLVTGRDLPIKVPRRHRRWPALRHHFSPQTLYWLGDPKRCNPAWLEKVGTIRWNEPRSRFTMEV